MTFMGVGTIMNLTAGNLSEDRTDYQYSYRIMYEKDNRPLQNKK